MNNKNAEWQHEFYLTHDKYRMQRQGTDCYKVVKGLTRILQLHSRKESCLHRRVRLLSAV